MNKEEADKNLEAHAADSSEAESSPPDIPVSADDGHDTVTARSVETDLPGFDSSEPKFLRTDSSVVKSSINLLVPKSNANTSSSEDVNSANSPVMGADVADSPGSAILPSGTEDSNMAHGDSDDRGYIPDLEDLADASDDDSPPSLFNEPEENAHYYPGDLPCEANSSSNQDSPGSDATGSDAISYCECHPMSDIDDEKTASSEDQHMSYIDNEIILSSAQEALSRKRSIRRQRGPLGALQEESSSSEVSAQNSPARRPFYKSIKRTRPAPKGQGQAAPSSEPQASTSRVEGQPAQSSEASTSRAEEPAQSSEASTSRVHDQPGDLSEASTSFARLQIRGQPDISVPSASSAMSSGLATVSSFPSTSFPRIRDIPINVAFPAASSVRTRSQPVVSSFPTTSFVRTTGIPLNITFSSAAPSEYLQRRAVPLNLSFSSGSVPRVRGQQLDSSTRFGALVRIRGNPVVLDISGQPVDLSQRLASFVRLMGDPVVDISGQSVDLAEQLAPYFRTALQPDDLLVIPSSSRNLEEQPPITLPATIVRDALNFSREEFGRASDRMQAPPQIAEISEEMTQLMWNSMQDGDVATALLALTHGADIHYCPKPNWTALHASILAGDAYFTEELLRRGALVNINKRSTPEGYTPLHLAALWNRDDIAALLLINGARAEKKDNKGNKPMVYAVKWKHEKLIQILNAANMPDDSEDTGDSEERVGTNDPESPEDPEDTNNPEEEGDETSDSL